MNKNSKHRNIDKTSVKSMIESLDLSNFIENNSFDKDKLNNQYARFFNQAILSRYKLLSGIHINIGNEVNITSFLRLTLDKSRNYFFSFEILFLLKILLVAAKTTKALDLKGNPKTDNISVALSFDKKLIDLINENQHEYGMYRLKCSNSFVNSQFTVNTTLPLLNKISDVFSLLNNQYYNINKTKVLHELSSQLNSNILNILLLNKKDIQKPSQFKLLEENIESVNLRTNLSLDEEIVKYILIENTIGFTTPNIKINDIQGELNDGLIGFSEGIIEDKGNETMVDIRRYIIECFMNTEESDWEENIDNITVYHRLLQQCRINFYQSLKKEGTSTYIDEQIKAYFFNENIATFYRLISPCDIMLTPPVDDTYQIPFFDFFKKENVDFFNKNNTTPYDDDTIKELLALIDKHCVKESITDPHGFYEKYQKRYNETIQPEIENNEKLTQMIHLLSISKEDITEKKATELVSLSIELLSQEKEKAEEKMNHLNTKLIELEEYKKNPIDFYDAYSLKKLDNKSDHLESPITTFKESLMTIINNIYQKD